MNREYDCHRSNIAEREGAKGYAEYKIPGWNEASTLPCFV